MKNNIANTSYLYDFNKIVLDFANDPSSENLYSELNEFLDNNEKSQYSYYISSMLSYIDFNNSNFEMVVPLQKQNILKNDNAMFKDISKINLAITYLEQDDYEKALKTIDNVVSDELKMLALDIKGDILKDQGDIKGSIESYKMALVHSNSNIPFENLLKSKIDLLSIPLNDKKYIFFLIFFFLFSCSSNKNFLLTKNIYENLPFKEINILKITTTPTINCGRQYQLC